MTILIVLVAAILAVLVLGPATFLRIVGLLVSIVLFLAVLLIGVAVFGAA